MVQPRTGHGYVTVSIATRNMEEMRMHQNLELLYLELLTDGTQM